MDPPTLKLRRASPAYGEATADKGAYAEATAGRLKCQSWPRQPKLRRRLDITFQPS
jgi:hypothetical protein